MTRRRDIDILEPYEVLQLIDAQPTRSWRSCRMRVLACLMARCQIRRGSVGRVRPLDVNLEKSTVRVQPSHAKLGHGYVAAMDQVTAEEIERFLPMRAAYLGGEHPEAPLLCTRNLTPIQDRTINRMVHDLQRRADLGHRRIHPHGLRHSGATELLYRGWDLAEIRDQLGHKLTTTTDVYLSRLARPSIAAKMRAIRLRGKPDARSEALRRLAEAKALLDAFSPADDPTETLDQLRVLATP